MSWDDNVYYNPEMHGLIKIAEVDLSEPCYSFDYLVAWGDSDGIYLGTDSGCSCPTPFEDYDGKKDLTGPLTIAQAIEEASSIKATHWEPEYDLDSWTQFLAEVAAFGVTS